MQNIPLPNKINFQKSKGNRATLVMEPLYPGYGVTLGNALRRILLSSLPGGAVTAVKIKGADHEFSTIPHVREDVLDIILNLKQLRLRVHSDQPVQLKLEAKGEREVKAKDIKADAQVEIINQELLIATLGSKEAHLDMEITAQQGRGYVPVEMREEEKLPIGTIAVDAVYSPVRTVNFEVEHVRVGQMTNFDKLTIGMETDGSITGEEAIALASEVLVDHFSLLRIGKLEEVKEEVAALPELVDIDTTTAVASDLEKLGLSNRALNALRKNEITTTGQLKQMSREELGALEGLGAKSVDEVVKALEKQDEAS